MIIKRFMLLLALIVSVTIPQTAHADASDEIASISINAIALYAATGCIAFHVFQTEHATDTQIEKTTHATRVKRAQMIGMITAGTYLFVRLYPLYRDAAN